jgi:hypothetical protein
MCDLGLSFYLGIEVRQDAEGITLRQMHYAKKILEMRAWRTARLQHHRWRRGSG